MNEINVTQKVVERFQNGASTEDLNGYTHTREFRVCVDTPGPAAHHSALNMEGIPQIGDFFPAGDGTRVIKRNARPMDANSKYLYLVTIEYGVIAFNYNQRQKKPWEKDSLFSFDFEDAPEPLQRDYSEQKKPVLNSAGDFFENQLMADKVRLKIHVSRSRLHYDPFTAYELMNTICPVRLELKGYGAIIAKKAKLKLWSGSENEYVNAAGSATRYYDEKIEIVCDKNAFVSQVLDAGYYERKGKEKPTRILDENGKPKATASLLNGAGAISEKPHYLEFLNSEPAGTWGKLLPL